MSELETYRRKRDFARTPEPAGGTRRGRRRPRAGLQFVVQQHAARRLHYDFRLELDGVLLSWAVPKGPSLDPGERRLAMRTEDHPLEYAAFEGVIPKGEYGGGTVVVWDRGVWTPEGDPRRGLARGSLRFELAGEKLRGSWRLVRTGGGEGEAGREAWLLIKRADAHAVRGGRAVVEAEPRSVLSGRTLEEVAAAPARVWRSNRGGEAGGARAPSGEPAAAGPTLGEPGELPGARRAPLPRALRPQLATPVATPPSGEAWLHEVKLDGYRILCRIEGGRARLITRTGLDWTGRMPAVAAAARALPCRSALLDGEAVVLDERGVSRFQRLQNAMHRGGEEVRLVAFDLVHLDGWDLTGAPLRARKEALRHLLSGLPAEAPLRLGDHLTGDGARVLEEACRLGLEGIVSKRADAPYAAGRRPRTWLKVKCLARQELAVVGFTDPQGTRAGFGALVLGLRDEAGAWRHAGRVGTGFDGAQLRALHRRLVPLERATPPVVDPPRGAAARGIHWVEPRLVVEVAFAGWTDEGSVRHASFLGLREDVPAEAVRRERPQPTPAGPRRRRADPRVGKVRVTHPERVVFPEAGITKLDLVRYYDAVAEPLLRHAQGRPLTLVRCPSGRGQRCFYQKRARPGVPASVPRVVIDKPEGDQLYLALSGRESLLALVQHGVIELHLWGSRADRLDRPDRLVFDLDPGPEVGWEQLADAARRVRALLASLGLASFLLGTGGKGLHVVLPLERRVGWDELKAFAGGVARRLARERPSELTAQLAKRKRGGKVFVDYLRNAREATAIAPYSARARPGGPIALPLEWGALEAAGPPAATVRDAERVAAAPDPWAGYFEVRQRLTRDAARAVGAAR